MAVQAQYPSNALLLNRSGQERRNNIIEGDFRIQSKADEIFQHSQILFGNGVGMNSQKRSRENIDFGAEPSENLFHIQQSPAPAVLSLAQLHRQPEPAPAVVSTGLRLAFDDQNQNQTQPFPHSVITSFLAGDFATQMKSQRDEIDQFLQAQEEHLRRTLAERHKAHVSTLLAAAEECAARKLREKGAELEKAARRKAELEEGVARLGAEARAWEARARQQESCVANLHAQLQQAIIHGVAHDNPDEPVYIAAKSPAADAESAYVDPRRTSSDVPLCRKCRRRYVSVVIFPCRHLCVCSECDARVNTCPLCHFPKSASIEVNFS